MLSENSKKNMAGRRINATTTPYKINPRRVSRQALLQIFDNAGYRIKVEYYNIMSIR